MAVARETTGMPLDEFIQQNSEQPFEFINGERKPKLPTVAGHSETIKTLRKSLEPYAEEKGLGEVFTETTFVLPNSEDVNWVRGARIPDVMFIAADRLTSYKDTHPDWREKPYLLVPDFVVEVISPTDRYSDVDEKIDAYLRDGVLLIWVIDPQRQKVVVYQPNAKPEHLSDESVLDGAGVVPGFRMNLQSLFE